MKKKILSKTQINMLFSKFYHSKDKNGVRDVFEELGIELVKNEEGYLTDLAIVNEKRWLIGKIKYAL